MGWVRHGWGFPSFSAAAGWVGGLGLGGAKGRGGLQTLKNDMWDFLRALYMASFHFYSAVAGGLLKVDYVVESKGGFGSRVWSSAKLGSCRCSFWGSVS